MRSRGLGGKGLARRKLRHPPQTTGGGGSGAFVGVLDRLSTSAYAAHAFVRLTSSWTGSAVCRLREDNGNTEDDFLADSGFLLNSSSQTVAAWLTANSATNAYVDTIYDQTGNSRDWTQPTNADQPLFSATGFNGAAAAVFDASNPEYMIGNDMSGAFTGNDTAYTAAISHTIDAPWGSAVKMAWQASHSSNADPFIAVLRSVTSNEFQTARRATAAGGAQTAAWDPIGDPSVTVVRHNGTTVDVWFNDDRKHTATSLNVNTMTLNQVTLGASRVGTTVASNGLDGMVASTILVASAISDADVDLLNA